MDGIMLLHKWYNRTGQMYNRIFFYYFKFILQSFKLLLLTSLSELWLIYLVYWKVKMERKYVTLLIYDGHISWHGFIVNIPKITVDLESPPFLFLLQVRKSTNNMRDYDVSFTTIFFLMTVDVSLIIMRLKQDK